MTFDASQYTDDNRITLLRGRKNPVDPMLPYGWMTEKERTRSGKIEETGIIFLTNRECPFRCLMCDLWKNTTDQKIPKGAIAAQIRYALDRMPSLRHIKLYNSGSFFDLGAIPEDDYPEIAYMLRDFETVIVESHPAFINRRAKEFRTMLLPELEVAIGLETASDEHLRCINKKMTTADFSKSVAFLNAEGISARAFILLRPPFMTEEEGLAMAFKSLEFAFETGVECCTIIPVRVGNGIMDDLLSKGDFTPPKLSSLEKALEYGIGLNKGRVFADTWDLGLFSDCESCFTKRVDRLTQMNLEQQILPGVICSNCSLDK